MRAPMLGWTSSKRTPWVYSRVHSRVHSRVRDVACTKPVYVSADVCIHGCCIACIAWRPIVTHRHCCLQALAVVWTLQGCHGRCLVCNLPDSHRQPVSESACTGLYARARITGDACPSCADANLLVLHDLLGRILETIASASYASYIMHVMHC